MALTVCDRDAVRLASCLVRGGDVEDAIGIDIKANLDLRNAAGGGRMPESLNSPRRLLSLAHAHLA